MNILYGVKNETNLDQSLEAIIDVVYLVQASQIVEKPLNWRGVCLARLRILYKVWDNLGVVWIVSCFVYSFVEGHEYVFHSDKYWFD